MDLHLENKVAFIAGSSRGIGKGIASAFLQEGSRVVITGRDTESLEHTQKALVQEWGEDKVFAVTGDLSQSAVLETSFKETMARWGQIDCVVANIGSGKSVSGWDIPDKAWDASFEQNFRASIRIADQALRFMIPAGSGSVVFIASITALEATSAPLPYSAAKAALVNYAGNLARHLATPHNIRVNCVAPGNILFPGGSWEQHLHTREKEVLDYIRTEVPMNRFGSVEEIADVVTFLSSDRASFVTGTCWTVDGGQTRIL